MQINKENKAFTLIELLVVLAVIGVLASIIAVNLSGATDRARIAKSLQFETSVHRLLGTDLVGWWNFNDLNDPLKDLSGYDNHGTWVGDNPIYVDGVPGKSGNAAEFGGDSYVSTEFRWNTMQEMTAMVWFMPRDLLGARGALGTLRWDGTRDNGRSFYRWSTTAENEIGWRIFYNDGQNSLWPRIAIAPDQWHHTAVTLKSNGESSYYMDGENYYSSSIPVNFQNWNSVMEIGGPYDYPLSIGQRGHSALFDGYIDDVRIFSRALTAQEVRQIYAETKSKYLAEK